MDKNVKKILETEAERLLETNKLLISIIESMLTNIDYMLWELNGCIDKENK